MIRKRINAKTFKHLLQCAKVCSFSIGAGDSSWIIREAQAKLYECGNKYLIVYRRTTERPKRKRTTERANCTRTWTNRARTSERVRAHYARYWANNKLKRTNETNNYLAQLHLCVWCAYACLCLGELLGNYCLCSIMRDFCNRVASERLCGLSARSRTTETVLRTTKSEITMWLIYGTAALWAFAFIVTIVRVFIIKR